MSITTRKIIKSKMAVQGTTCPCCGKPATDGHEIWIPKGAVMCASDEKKRAINHEWNIELVCNDCNIHMTHEKEVLLRRGKLLKVGRKAMGEYADMSDEREVIDAGVELVQSWINSLDMKTRYSARSLAEL